MGEILFQTGLATRAIDAIDRLISRVPGRLSLVAIVGGTIFSALSGSTVANTAMLGSTLLPEMKKRGYHSSMSMGPILGTGSLAILVPPSALAVLLGSLAQISISDLLLGGIVPGLMLGVMFFGYVIIRCKINPSLAPVYAEERQLSRRERYVPFFRDVLPLLGIFVVVVGSILGGIATPTEAAALGAVASFIAALIYRRITWDSIVKTLLATTRTSVMILLIVAASITFSQILAFSGATSGLLSMITSWDLGPLQLVFLMLAILLVLGCFVDQLSMIMITLPFFMPLVRSTGTDQVWFGVLMLLMLEVSFTTPPFGMLLFVLRGVAPGKVSIKEIYAAATPFILMVLFLTMLIIFVPQLATGLPTLLAANH